MHLSTHQTTALAQVFGLLAENLVERDIRVRLGQALLGLLQADHFASFVWDSQARRFGNGVWLGMDPANLARYDQWFQYNDPITFALQARRHATPVSAVMPHRALVRTEFFNDFLARDGLHWGINLHAFDGDHALGDLRIWRGRHRQDFEPHDTALLNLIEPAFIAALRRTQALSAAAAAPSAALPHESTLGRSRVDSSPSGGRPPQGGGLAGVPNPPGKPALAPSRREQAVAAAVARGLTDKQIARELGLSVSSVRTYLGRLFEKSGVQRRAGLVAWAARWAADAPPPPDAPTAAP